MKTVIRHFGKYFEEVSQSFFFRNSDFGVTLLALLYVFDRKLFFCALFGSVTGYLSTVFSATPKILRDSGLVTVNGLFFGLAVASLFDVSPQFYVCLVAGSLAVPLLTKSAYEVLQHWKLSPLIGPYIVAVWIVWLCAHGINLGARPDAMPAALAYLPSLHPGWNAIHALAWSVSLGMGRLLFLPDALFGFALLALVTLFSPRRGVFFVAGSLAASLASWALAGGAHWWEYGYFNFSAGLVGLGLASLPENYHRRTIFFFCVISAFLTLALYQFFDKLGLPILSLPYVLTFWVALLYRVPRLNISWAPSKRYLSAGAAILLLSAGYRAKASPSKAVFSADLTYASEYMTDGFNVGGNSPVWEPAVAVAFVPTGLSLMTWSSIQSDRRNSQYDEYDLFLNYGKTFFAETRHALYFHCYYDYWLYPNTPPALDEYGDEYFPGDKKGNKLHAGVTMPNLVTFAGGRFVPSYNAYYWIYWALNRADLYEGGTHHELLLEYVHDIPKLFSGIKAQTAEISGSLNYNDGAFGVQPGWSHSVLQVSTAVSSAHNSRFVLSFNKQWSYLASVDPVNETWTTLSFEKQL